MATANLTMSQLKCPSDRDALQRLTTSYFLLVAARFLHASGEAFDSAANVAACFRVGAAHV
jgi:hypothetical protein